MTEILMAKNADLADHIASRDNPHNVTLQQLGLENAVNGIGITKLIVGKLGDRPIAGVEKGDIFVSLSSLQVFVFTGSGWEELARAPSRIGPKDLGFEAAVLDDAERVRLDEMVRLREQVSTMQAELEKAQGELRLLLDYTVNKGQEVETLKTRVAQVESRADAGSK